MKGLLNTERTIFCEYCHKKIVTSHPTQRFCNKKCKWNYENHKRNYISKDSRIEKKCAWCGKNFFPKSVKHPHQIYCSKECKNVYTMNKWEKKNPKKALIIQKKYYSKNRKRIIARKIAYRKTPQGQKVYRNCARRYTLKRKLKVGDTQLSLKEIEFVKQRDNNQCVYCKRNGRLSLDHIIPLKNNGKDVIENVVVSCVYCNSSKKETPVEDWCEQNGMDIPKIVKELLKKQRINIK